MPRSLTLSPAGRHLLRAHVAAGHGTDETPEQHAVADGEDQARAEKDPQALGERAERPARGWSERRRFWWKNQTIASDASSTGSHVVRLGLVEHHHAVCWRTTAVSSERADHALPLREIASMDLPAVSCHEPGMGMSDVMNLGLVLAVAELKIRPASSSSAFGSAA